MRKRRGSIFARIQGSSVSAVAAAGECADYNGLAGADPCGAALWHGHRVQWPASAARKCAALLRDKCGDPDQHVLESFVGVRHPPFFGVMASAPGA